MSTRTRHNLEAWNITKSFQGAKRQEASWRKSGDEEEPWLRAFSLAPHFFHLEEKSGNIHLSDTH